MEVSAFRDFPYFLLRNIKSMGLFFNIKVNDVALTLAGAELILNGKNKETVFIKEVIRSPKSGPKDNTTFSSLRFSPS
jgi:hypothetical protein